MEERGGKGRRGEGSGGGRRVSVSGDEGEVVRESERKAGGRGVWSGVVEKRATKAIHTK